MDIAVPLSSSNSHAFTPVRRRESTINTRVFDADQEQEWTAARCHRLLRALTSRVAILKKDILWLQDTAKENIRNERATIPQDSRSADAEWTKTKRRIRQTYSSRGGRSGSNPQATKRGLRSAAPKRERGSILPGEITIPTPILARARGNKPPVFQAPWSAHDEPRAEVVRANKRPRTRYPANDGDGQFHQSETLRELRQKIPASRYTIYEGIYNGLEALLRATTKDGTAATTKPKGARSLLSMTLHAVPRYITQQEGLIEAHMEATGSRKALDQRDISTEIYDELESFGPSRYGWKCLKDVVRSHGIQVIRESVHSGLFEDSFCGVLIALCVNTFAIEEAQSILSALVSSREYPSPRTLYDTPSRPLRMLSNFTDFTSLASFQFRELSSIMASGLLPLEWLATKEFGSIWTKAMQRISPGQIDDDAIAFLDNALSLLSSAGPSPSTSGSNAVTEAVKNTFSSLLTTLSSIVILSKEAQRKDNYKIAHQSTQYDHITAILGGCLVECGSADKQILLLLSNLIIQGDIVKQEDQNCSLVDLLLARLQHKSISAASPSYFQAVNLICQVARCCGRASTSPGLAHLEQIHLLMFAAAAEKDETSIVQGLIVDSAFAFAQKVPDREHIDYAAIVDERYSARRLDVEIGLHETTGKDCDEDLSGFRWEEGIGEWVTATPAGVAKTKAVAAKAFCGYSEFDTPYRPPPKLRRLESQVAAVMYRNASPFSSPNFDDSVRVQSLSSRSGSVGAVTDIASEDDKPAHNDITILTNSYDELDSAVFLGKADSEDEADLSEMDVSVPDYSLIWNGSTTSLASMASPERRPIDRGPRLKRKLLRNSHEWQNLEDSFVSTATAACSNEGGGSTGYREHVDRAPRLGRRALRPSQAWKLFEDSDDELSILSGSSRSDQALRDATSSGKSNARRPRQVTEAIPPKSSSLSIAPLSDSEDELCI
ncbi:hypothetical protein ONS95_014864 [Cadophora gregata]|uniref:uncharacterized protein n=1 Tax=Cadophora gregata TaxID=51156 RepID=UPI0026DACEA0|nr:uncharacterized protein ONS95_014864 [Cadophora gregata]KAK0113165.1 hypothetical protein ONS95_014864 [Cadophora gregata]KAK0125207.1 hypothetical protein ONS96_009065 [Cadophora gregata f. sp. sojae]